MSTPKKFNKYEYINRTVKAAKLSAVLIDVEADPATFTDEQWIMAGQAAKLLTEQEAKVLLIRDAASIPVILWPTIKTRARTIELLTEVRMKAAALLDDIRKTVPK